VLPVFTANIQLYIAETPYHEAAFAVSVVSTNVDHPPGMVYSLHAVDQELV